MKRGQGETSGAPPSKKQFAAIPAVNIGPVSTEVSYEWPWFYR